MVRIEVRTTSVNRETDALPCATLCTLWLKILMFSCIVGTPTSISKVFQASLAGTAELASGDAS
jgi:hypothetical protein